MVRRESLLIGIKAEHQVLPRVPRDFCSCGYVLDGVVRVLLCQADQEETQILGAARIGRSLHYVWCKPQIHGVSGGKE